MTTAVFWFSRWAFSAQQPTEFRVIGWAQPPQFDRVGPRLHVEVVLTPNDARELRRALDQFLAKAGQP